MSTISLAGCAILKDGKILLIKKQTRDVWELPGGMVKDGADEEATAVEKTESQIGVAPTIIQQFTILEFQKEGKNIEGSIFESVVDDDVSFALGENIERVEWFDIEGIETDKIGNDVKAVLEEMDQ